MKNKIIASILLAASISLTAISSFAMEPGAPILLNKRTLFYEKNAPVTVNGRTLVPIDNFFRLAGIKSNYYEKENKIIVDSNDDKKRIALFLNDPVMQVYTYKTILQADRKDVNLDAAPQIIDDVIMCPLRAVLEELGFEVLWNETDEVITVNTKEPVNQEDIPELKLSANVTDVNAGDTIELYVTLSNYDEFKENNTLAAVTNTVIYDKTEFSFVSSELVPDKPETIGLEATNENFNNYGVKATAIVMNYPIENDEIKCLKLTFTALTDNGGTFVLSDKFNLLRGHDTGILLRSSESKTVFLENMNQIKLDTTPIIIK